MKLEECTQLARGGTERAIVFAPVFQLIFVVALCMAPLEAAFACTPRYSHVKFFNSTSSPIFNASFQHKASNREKMTRTIPLVMPGDYSGPMWVKYWTGANCGKDWWLVQWTDQSGKVHMTNPNNFRAIFDGMEQLSKEVAGEWDFSDPAFHGKVAKKVVMRGATGAKTQALLLAKAGPKALKATKFMRPGPVGLAAEMSLMTLNTYVFNTESTAGFKQHNLTASDHGKELYIKIQADNTQVVFVPQSGDSSSTTSVARADEAEVYNKLVRDNRSGLSSAFKPRVHAFSGGRMLRLDFPYNRAPIDHPQPFGHRLIGELAVDGGGNVIIVNPFGRGKGWNVSQCPPPKFSCYKGVETPLKAVQAANPRAPSKAEIDSYRRRFVVNVDGLSNVYILDRNQRSLTKISPPYTEALDTVKLPAGLGMDQNWDYRMTFSGDLVAINRRGSNNKTDIHLLHAPDYRDYRAHCNSALHNTENRTWDFAVDSSDHVVAINRQGSGGTADFHTLDVNRCYQSFLSQMSSQLGSERVSSEAYFR